MFLWPKHTCLVFFLQLDIIIAYRYFCIFGHSDFLRAHTAITAVFNQGWRTAVTCRPCARTSRRSLTTLSWSRTPHVTLTRGWQQTCGRPSSRTVQWVGHSQRRAKCSRYPYNMVLLSDIWREGAAPSGLLWWRRGLAAQGGVAFPAWPLSVWHVRIRKKAGPSPPTVSGQIAQFVSHSKAWSSCTCLFH